MKFPQSYIISPSLEKTHQNLLLMHGALSSFSLEYIDKQSDQTSDNGNTLSLEDPSSSL